MLNQWKQHELDLKLYITFLSYLTIDYSPPYLKAIFEVFFKKLIKFSLHLFHMSTKHSE